MKEDVGVTKNLRQLAALALSAALVFAACETTASPAPSGAATQPPGTGEPSDPSVAAPPTQIEELTVATFDTEFTLTALDINYGYPGFELAKLQYDSLTGIDTGNEVREQLATQWESNDDATEWTFTLRDDVTWHDGEAFTADDVAFTVRYENDVVRGGGAFTVLRGFEAEVIDDTHVTITTPQPEPELDRKLMRILILPEHIWDGVGDVEDLEESNRLIVELADHTGTGPYMMGDYDPDRFYTFIANDNYFLGPPAVKRIVVPIIKDTTALFAALRSGEVDAVVPPLQPENIADFQNQPNIELVEGPTFSTRTLQINAAKEPFDDPIVRRAIGMMIDPQELVDVVKLGQAVIGSQGYIHPNLPGAVQGLTLERDSAGANQLLEDAGYRDTDGDGVRETPDGEPMAYDVVAWAEEPDMIRAADLIREWGAEIGLDLTTAATETNAAVDLVWPGFNRSESGPASFDLAVWNWSSGVLNVPSQALELFYDSDVVTGRLNVDFYESSEMDGLIDSLTATTDLDERLTLMAQIQELAFEDLPFIVLWYPVDTYAYNASAYDGWRFQDGLGIINRLSFLPQVYP